MGSKVINPQFITFMIFSLFLAASDSKNEEFVGDETNSSLPFPHIVIVGATGVGKSSLANVLIGESPLCSNCTFPVCTDASSCTKETTYAIKPWLGAGKTFTVVDTPGFGDSDQDDSMLVDEMMSVLKDSVKSANVLLLALKGTETRLDNSLQQMLREMKALFGDDMWTHVIVEVSFWPYSEYDIDKRNRTCAAGPEYCHDENWFKQVMLAEIEAKFHVGIDIPFVFIDSWAKHPAEITDPFQSEAFERETNKLWDLTNRMEDFNFKSVQDVLNENQELKLKVSYLEGILESNITEIFHVLTENMEDISDLRIKQAETFHSLTAHENHLSTVDSNLNFHSSLLEVQNQTLMMHNQKFDETKAAVQGNSAQITAQGESINVNNQLITAVGDELHNQINVVTNDIGAVRSEVIDLSSKTLRRCRICYDVQGNDWECMGQLNGCSGYSQWNVGEPDWSPIYIDDTDDDYIGCSMKWRVECQTSLE